MGEVRSLPHRRQAVYRILNMTICIIISFHILKMLIELISSDLLYCDDGLDSMDKRKSQQTVFNCTLSFHEFSNITIYFIISDQ